MPNWILTPCSLLRQGFRLRLSTPSGLAGFAETRRRAGRMGTHFPTRKAYVGALELFNKFRIDGLAESPTKLADATSPKGFVGTGPVLPGLSAIALGRRLE